MSPNCMANSAIEACYTYGDEWVDEQNAYLTENAEFVISYLKDMHHRSNLLNQKVLT